MYVKTEGDRVATLTGDDLGPPVPSEGWLAYQEWLADGNKPIKVTAKRQPPVKKNASARKYRKASTYFKVNDHVAVTDDGVRVTAPQPSDEWRAYLDWRGEGNEPQERFTQEQWDALPDEARRRLHRQRPLDAQRIEVAFANGDMATVTYSCREHLDEDDEDGVPELIIEIERVVVKGEEIAPTFARANKIRRRIREKHAAEAAA
jgi:hypothetical protein